MTSDNCFKWSPNQNNQTFKNFILTTKTVIVAALDRVVVGVVVVAVVIVLPQSRQYQKLDMLESIKGYFAAFDSKFLCEAN